MSVPVRVHARCTYQLHLCDRFTNVSQVIRNYLLPSRTFEKEKKKKIQRGGKGLRLQFRTGVENEETEGKGPGTRVLARQLVRQDTEMITI